MNSGPDGLALTSYAPHRLRYVQCASPSGLHRLAYYEWGDPANRDVVICVHGLTRSGRDFAALATRLAERYRVVAPDVAGRGESQWLADPDEYQVPFYVADMVTLIARLDVQSVRWVGTSMGGLIGMGLAALQDTPIERLVLNDVGPVITAVSLARIGQYVGTDPRFASYAQAEQYIRFVCAPFGPHTDDQWRFLTDVVVRPAGEGGYRLHYDPAIATPFRTQAAGSADVVLWPMYDAIRAPTMIMRGALSDLLTRDTALEMTRRGPRATLVEVPGIGHAPTLLDAAQIDPIVAFLAR